MSEAIKSEIINNVIVAMSYYISEKEILEALEHIISNELVKVNVQDITTMPETWQSDTQKRNQYLIQLFMIKKRSLSHQTMDLKNRGVDIGIIQEVLGHASPAVTSMYYAQSTQKTLRNIRERIAA